MWVLSSAEAIAWAKPLRNLWTENAFRHCIWQRLLAARTSKRKAATWGYIHESSAANVSPTDRTVDLHNNAVGRSLSSEPWAWTLSTAARLCDRVAQWAAADGSKRAHPVLGWGSLSTSRRSMSHLRPGQNQLTRAILLMWVVVLSAACQPSAASRPLNGTLWRVVEIAGEPVEEQITLAFDSPRLGSVTLTTPCRQEELAFAFDTDGTAVSFASPIQDGLACDLAAQAADAATAAALADAAEWLLVSESTIEVRGGPTLTLEEALPRSQ